MGLADSKEKHDNTDDDSTSKDSEIPPTILPLDKEVRVHLVPKFYTSEERGFTRSYCLLVTLQRDVDLHHAVINYDQDLTATVEFHERRLGSFSASSTIPDRSEFFSLKPWRSRSMTVKSINGLDIEVKKVTVKENDSLRITGVFKRNLGSIENLTNCNSFDLILCPSFRINSHCSEWLLLGTMYTKHANSKHMRHWRAAVRADYT